MEYLGVKYGVQRVTPDVWKWSVLIGEPAMLRRGEAETEQQAEIEARAVIDRALTLQKTLHALRISRAMGKGRLAW
jgi:hypothetical protein